MKLFHQLISFLNQAFYKGNDLIVVNLVGCSSAPRAVAEMVKKSVNLVEILQVLMVSQKSN